MQLRQSSRLWVGRHSHARLGGVVDEKGRVK